jgi:hypothetical protein
MRPASKKKRNSVLTQPDKQSSRSMCLLSNSRKLRSIIRCMRMPSSTVRRLLTINYAMLTEANSINRKKNLKCLLSSKEIAAGSNQVNSNLLMISLVKAD